MNDQQHEQRLEYIKQKEFYEQIKIETAMSELTRLLDVYQITDTTECSTLEAGIWPLKAHLDLLLNQLRVIKERALCALHYSEIEFEEIEVNNTPAFFTTVRVDRDYLPKDYYAYDIRSDGEKEFATIELFVKANHHGTILTKRLFEMGKEDSISIIDNHFLGRTIVGYYLTPTTTSIQELIDTYNARYQDFLEKIERKCKFSEGNNESTKINCPSLTKEVIVPIHLSMAEYLRKKKIEVKIPNPDTYYPIAKYFRIRVGGRIVGGFHVSINSSSVYYMPFRHRTLNTTISEEVKITDIKQLCQLIWGQLNGRI